jgi:hypothetical protein
VRHGSGSRDGGRRCDNRRNRTVVIPCATRHGWTCFSLPLLCIQLGHHLEVPSATDRLNGLVFDILAPKVVVIENWSRPGPWRHRCNRRKSGSKPSFSAPNPLIQLPRGIGFHMPSQSLTSSAIGPTLWPQFLEGRMEFKFRPELLEYRARVMEVLTAAGFFWLGHFSCIDLDHRDSLLEVDGIRDEDTALGIAKALASKFSWASGCMKGTTVTGTGWSCSLFGGTDSSSLVPTMAGVPTAPPSRSPLPIRRNRKER